MNQNREIRFLIPPFFLFLSLLWGTHYDQSIDLESLLNPDSTRSILGIIAIGSTSILPLGFLIASISVIILKAAFSIFKRQTYEMSISPDSLGRIWPKLDIEKKQDKKLAFYAGVTFDHQLIPTEIHEWIVRRWNAFNTSIHSCVALLLAHGVAWTLSIRQDYRWSLLTIMLITIFMVNAVFTWRDTMRMIDFQSHRSLANPHANQIGVKESQKERGR